MSLASQRTTAGTPTLEVEVMYYVLRILTRLGLVGSCPYRILISHLFACKDLSSRVEEGVPL